MCPRPASAIDMEMTGVSDFQCTSRMKRRRCGRTGYSRPRAACKPGSGAVGQGDTLLGMDLSLDVVDGVRQLDLEGDCLAGLEVSRKRLGPIWDQKRCHRVTER